MRWPPPPDWPFAAQSTRIPLPPHEWHVQQLGDGPLLVLLHGAGGATHSWRGLAPILAERFRLVMIDLPGHGYTRSPRASRSGLDAMAEDVARLMQMQGWQPRAVIGHSAGAAVALRISLDLSPRGQRFATVGINPALTPFEGVAGWLFPAMARLLAINPLTPSLFTLRGGSPRQARKLIEGTGSTLDPEGYRLYARLLGDRDHVNGALQMMARWSLDRLLAELPRLEAPALFITGDRDRAVAPKVADRTAARMQRAEVTRLDGLGHLAHEEDPQKVADEILSFLDRPNTGA
ncbi:alpha/beta fold hydrolase BchO [Pseudoponticoccus marisrubri]|uniref:Magnesium chelatase n=1 Tax=Pseudoponticoccus marisrubri TaxID=1685382 RepID=A0A0W7WHH3_9RHOB|nr:alpha/beta fold hydrolase BchO [Pseudoponticoccus marisrubri]KUF10021.1 magnesium chelatase [Pseudoponticoccus marisrubri]